MIDLLNLPKGNLTISRANTAHHTRARHIIKRLNN